MWDRLLFVLSEYDKLLSSTESVDNKVAGLWLTEQRNETQDDQKPH